MTRCALLAVALILAGCQVTDQATRDLTDYSAGYVRQREAQEDALACGAAALYCQRVTLGAASRRYTDPATWALRQQVCAAEAAIGCPFGGVGR